MDVVVQTCYHDPGSIHPARIALSVEELRRRDGLGYAVAVITVESLGSLRSVPMSR